MNQNPQPLTLADADFIRHFVTNAPHMMWFLGAGSSRTAGMPTATDLIWQLKRNYYCAKENQDIQTHDVNNSAVKRKIQTYMDSKGFPQEWSQEEYSFYFDLMFDGVASEQQKFLQNQLSPEKISLNIGHRVLAGLMALEQCRLVFTTNFDEVIEKAYAEVSGKVLPTFHLEGSAAAVAALNSERFPVYAKIHGDFRYESVKNLTADLLENDEEIRRCLITASNHYGMVVSGYSGRDGNVMRMFNEALNSINPFPHGIYWAVTDANRILPVVNEFISTARAKGIRAYVVEAGTFDIMLSKIWKQVPARTEEIDAKVRSALAKSVSVPLPKPGKGYPLIRTNGLAILQCPDSCARVEIVNHVRFDEMQSAKADSKARTVITRGDRWLAWGDEAEIRKVFAPGNVSSIGKQEIVDPAREIAKNTFMKSFYEEALTRALRQDKPLLLRQYHRQYSLIVDPKQESHQIFNPLKAVVGYKGPGKVSGPVPRVSGAIWSESIDIKLEERGGTLVLLLNPGIWVSPQAERQNCIDFLRSKRRPLYNPKQYDILDAWIKILFGAAGAQDVVVVGLPNTDFPAKFIVNTRSIFSGSDSHAA